MQTRNDKTYTRVSIIPPRLCEYNGEKKPVVFRTY